MLKNGLTLGCKVIADFLNQHQKTLTFVGHFTITNQLIYRILKNKMVILRSSADQHWKSTWFRQEKRGHLLCHCSLRTDSKSPNGSDDPISWLTPCKWVEGPRSLVLERQEHRASKTNFHNGQLAVSHEVPLRGTYRALLKDQAANLPEVLAWSFSLKSVLRTACFFEDFTGHQWFHIKNIPWHQGVTGWPSL